MKKSYACIILMKRRRNVQPAGRGFLLPKARAVHYIGKSCRSVAAGRMMQPYRVLEHTADVGFETWGATREEVFSNAACALQDLMVEVNTISPREEMVLRIEGEDAPALLVNWLSHILYLFDAEGRVFHDFEVQHLEDRTLEAVAHGENFDRARHAVKLQVKAITYHQLALEPTPEGWRARVFVDI